MQDNVHLNYKTYLDMEMSVLNASGPRDLLLGDINKTNGDEMEMVARPIRCLETKTNYFIIGPGKTLALPP